MDPNVLFLNERENRSVRVCDPPYVQWSFESFLWKINNLLSPCSLSKHGCFRTRKKGIFLLEVLTEPLKILITNQYAAAFFHSEAPQIKSSEHNLLCSLNKHAGFRKKAYNTENVGLLEKKLSARGESLAFQTDH